MDLGSRLVEELGVNPVFHIGPIVITESIVNTWILIFIVFLVCFFMTRNLSVNKPSKRQLAVEQFVTWIQNTAKGMLGEHASQYTDYICTVLIFVAVTNLSAILETKLTPEITFMKPPTKDLNITVALALMSIVLVESAGIITKGVHGWMKSFSQPVAIITPINVLEIFIKPLSLCMRLFGNVFGGFIIMELIKCLLPVGIPIAFSFYFDVFDGLIQAYVFVFLTSIYIQEAVE